MKILISAYHCEPGKGSEHSVGWSWVLQLAKFHDVFVITETGWRNAIEKSLAQNPISRLKFVYLDLPPWALFWEKGRLGFEAHHYLWQLLAYFVGRRMHKKIGFDLVHHITFGRYWTPSFLSLLPLPFIWGPVGGGESSPASFWPLFSLRGRIFELLRDFARNLGEWDPFVRATARRSAVAVATTEQTAVRLKMLGARQVVVHPQFGMTPDERRFFGSLGKPRQKPFRFISMGRLLPWKGFHLGLLAFARLHQSHPDAEYWIVNDGIEMGHLKELARKLGVEQKVTFWGKLPTLHDVHARLAECDVLVHPALHEAFGNVCLEALASGRPVLCLDLGGPALQVQEGTGIKVTASSPEETVAELAAAMIKLASDPDLCVRMGRAAQRSVEERFDWDRKGKFMAKVYDDALRAWHVEQSPNSKYELDVSEKHPVKVPSV
jgi:glycosyltransferase involved in cell wall biosynthesis